MARIFAIIGFSFMAALIALNYAFADNSLVLFFVVVAIFAITLPFRKIRQALVVPTALLSAAAACLLFYIVTESSYNRIVALAGESVDVTATVCDMTTEANESGRYYLTLKTQTVNGQKIKCKLRLSVGERSDAQLYDTVSFNGKLYVLASARESYHLYYKSHNVYLGAFTYSGITCVQNKTKPLNYYIQKERQKSITILTNLFPREKAGLLIALLFGDKTLMEPQLLDNLRVSGIAHLIAVSGIHMNAWALMIFLLLRRRRINEKISAFLCCIAVVVLMAFCSFSASVMRAGIMMLIFFLGKILGRSPDSINSLGFSALCLMIKNPYVVCDWGFLLTVSATLGVIVANKHFLPAARAPLEAKLPRKLFRMADYSASLVLFSVAAQLFTLPVTVLLIGDFSTYSIFSNILISPAAVLCMFISGMLTLVGGVSVIRVPLVFAVNGLCSYIGVVAKGIAALPLARLNTDYVFSYIWIAVCCIMVAVVVIFVKNKSKGFKLVALSGFALLLLLNIISDAVLSNMVRVEAVNVGNGTAVLISSDGKGCLVGCGGEYFAADNINGAIDKANVKLEVLILPRCKETESGAACEVLKANGADLIFACGNSANAVPLQYRSAMQQTDSLDITLWDKVRLTGCSDDDSCCIMANICGTELAINMLPGGDSYKCSSQIGDARLLICRHEIPEALNTDDFGAVIISDNGNGTRTENYGSNVCVTGDCGAVRIYITENKYYIRRCG